jgi:uncharacterized protein (TIGR00369 family)
MRVSIPEPPDNPACFACSAKNPEGMHLRFFLEDERFVTTEFTAPRTWSGWGDILHGGFQSLLLDETCSWAYATLAQSRSFVTAKLEVAFKRPVRVQQPLVARAWLEQRGERETTVAGEILDDQGLLLTTGRAVIRELSAERFREVANQAAISGRFRAAE